MKLAMRETEANEFMDALSDFVKATVHYETSNCPEYANDKDVTKASDALSDLLQGKTTE